MSSEMWASILFVSFLTLKFNLIDKVVLKIENTAYTLTDLRNACLITALLDNKPPHLCFQNSFLERYLNENFIKRELIWLTFQPDKTIKIRFADIASYPKAIEDNAEFQKAIEKAGMSEATLRRELQKEIVIRKYIKDRFGNMKNAEAHLKLIEKSAKIKLYFKERLWNTDLKNKP